jgi:predicted metalloprotease
MRFNPKARLDRSQVQVRRGGGRGGFSGGGRGLPIPAGVGGGGLGGVLLLVIVFVVVQSLNGGGSGFAGPRSSDEPVSTSELTECRTGQDANENPDCARLAVVNSIQDFWARTLPQQTGQAYEEAGTIIFSGQVDTGCGAASSQVGPFYCPVRGDRQVYLDTTFFDDMLEGQLGAQGGDFAEAYVLAHEYGHHVENLLGYLARSRTQQGPESDAVRIELMADCLAGMWAKHATSSPDETGEVLIVELDQQDIDEAMDAAAAVGDDRIQERAGGRSDPESWTHGSAAARQMWFDRGWTRGTVQDCDTFRADQLYPG